MKYIIFDMDDTLLTDKKEVTPYTLKILKKLQSMGHKIVINTARSKAYNQEYFDLIKPDYAILNGGALIIDKAEKVIFKALIENNKVKKIIEDLLVLSTNFNVQTLDKLYTYSKTYKNQGAIYFDFSKEEFNDDALKIVATIKNKEDRVNLALKYDLEYIDYFGGEFARLNNKLASKELGNLNLLKLTGADVSDSIVFGDDWGDVKMLNEAGVGVLMANSKDEVKELVKVHSEYDNNHDGVARFLEAYFNL